MTRIDIAVELPSPVELRRVRDQAGLTSGPIDVDPFDSSARFVVARGADNGELIGVVRLTVGVSPVNHWSAGKYLPEGSGIVEIARGAVTPSHQGKGIYRTLMIRAMQWAANEGQLATAAVAPSFRHLGFLEQLGFRETGRPFTFRDPFLADNPTVTLLAISCILGLDGPARWERMRQALRETANSRLVEFVQR